MDENNDELIAAEETAQQPEQDPRKKWIPLGIVGVIVVGSLVFTNLSSGGGDEVPNPEATATAPPTVIASPQPSEDGDHSDEDGHNHNDQPVPVPDPEVTFATTAPPPKSVEERKIPANQNPTQAPSTPEWKPAVEKFANAWGNVSVGKEKWLANMKPYLTDRAYESMTYVELDGLEKRTVESVDEITFDGSGYAFNVNFKEDGAKSMTGTAILDNSDGWKWKVDIISEGVE